MECGTRANTWTIEKGQLFFFWSQLVSFSFLISCNNWDVKETEEEKSCIVDPFAFLYYFWTIFFYIFFSYFLLYLVNFVLMKGMKMHVSHSQINLQLSLQLLLYFFIYIKDQPITKKQFNFDNVKEYFPLQYSTPNNLGTPPPPKK